MLCLRVNLRGGWFACGLSALNRGGTPWSSRKAMVTKFIAGHFSERVGRKGKRSVLSAQRGALRRVVPGRERRVDHADTADEHNNPPERRRRPRRPGRSAGP